MKTVGMRDSSHDDSFVMDEFDGFLLFLFLYFILGLNPEGWIKI